LVVTNREEEESQLLEKLRNLSISISDDEIIGNRTAKEDEELP
jgi:hypothetical protein